MKQIVIAGDSHIAPIKRGFDTAPEGIKRRILFAPLGRGGMTRSDFFTTDKKQRRVLVEAALARRTVLPLAEAAPDAVYAVSLPLNTSRILRDYQWNRFVPWQLAQTSKEIPLSDEAMLRLIHSDADRAIAFVSALSEIGLDVLAIEAPMFFEDAAYLGSFRFDVCHAVAMQYRDYVLRRLDALKIGVVAQPRSTLTRQGTTDLVYNHENPTDTHHANAKFGRIMLDEVVKFIDACS